MKTQWTDAAEDWFQQNQAVRTGMLERLDEPVPSEEQLGANPTFDDEYRAPNLIIYALRKPEA